MLSFTLQNYDGHPATLPEMAEYNHRTPTVEPPGVQDQNYYGTPATLPVTTEYAPYYPDTPVTSGVLDQNQAPHISKPPINSENLKAGAYYSTDTLATQGTAVRTSFTIHVGGLLQSWYVNKQAFLPGQKNINVIS